MNRDPGASGQTPQAGMSIIARVLPLRPPRRGPGIAVDILASLGILALVALTLNTAVLFRFSYRRRRQALLTAWAALTASQLEAELLKRGQSDLEELEPSQVVDRLERLQEAGLGVQAATLVASSLDIVVESGVRVDGPPLFAEDLRRALVTRQPQVDSRLVGDSLIWRPRYLFVSAPILSRGQVVGGLRVTAGAEPDLATLTNTERAFLVAQLVLGVIVVTLFGAVRLNRRVTAPLSRLVKGTEQLSMGDFTVRVKDPPPNEIADLFHSFNGMARALGDFQARTSDQVQRLSQMNERLRVTQQSLIHSEKMASIGRMAAGIAHEVGNPLSAVIGFVDLLREDLPPDMQDDLLVRTRSELERIHLIIRDLLEFARPQADQQLEDVDIIEVIERTAQLVGMQKRFHGVELSVEIDQQVPRVRAHPSRLQQVLLNLFLNAADAMEGEGQIRVEVDRRGRRVQLAVEDSGPGVPEDQRDRIFEPFFSTKGAGSGTGLGLSVSQRIVGDMNGELRCEAARTLTGARLCVELKASDPLPGMDELPPEEPLDDDVISSIVDEGPLTLDELGRLDRDG